MNDEQIVELYWQRDESAITVTQEKYNAYLMKIARNILNDTEDSEESVNDTYLAAWKSMPPQKPTVLSTYLGKLTRRISISMFRKREIMHVFLFGAERDNGVFLRRRFRGDKSADKRQANAYHNHNHRRANRQRRQRRNAR